MRKVCILTVLLSVAMLAVVCSTALALGRLKIHPSNPHYFQEDGTGRPILIASYTNMVPETTYWDDIGGLSWYTMRRRLGYCRVWHVGAYSDGGFLPWNFTSTAACGSWLPARVDMTTNNPIYWTRMDSSLSYANSGDVYAEVMVFDRCSMSPPAEDRWINNVWATDNNVNSLETPSCSPGDGTPEFYGWQSRPNLAYFQAQWVRKLVDETIQWPNCIYEVENEHWQSNSLGWADHYGQLIKDHIATYYPSSPRLVSYSSIESDADLDQCYTMPAIDIVNPHWGDELEADPSIANTYLEARWGYNKAMNVDEFANNCADPNIVRTICWTIVSSGGNYHIEDALDPARGYEVCENIRSFMTLSGWNFINCAPQKSLITSGGGYCMRNTGVEYMCYFPTGGSKTITLSAATYNQKWWNPRTGGFYNVSSFAHGGGSKVLSTPDANDWVLHLTTGTVPAKTLTCKYATTAITIDGATNDWVPGQSKIRGGDVGTGNIGIVEFDTNNVCYVGGNLDAGGQVLPFNGNDHAVTVSSRYDASYVYFMVRCNDDDVRYPNGVSSNYLNDCVEFYIDPGNNGGSTAISNSTSDVQLVIDANNQKNVYSTTSGYATQVLAGVTSAVVRDSKGWTLEVRLTKSVLDPDIPATGTVGVEYSFRDNDNNNDAALTTVCGWSDPEVSAAFPSKIPDRWGDLNLETYSDSTAPAAVTGFSATAGSGQVTLNWTKPSTSDFTGTVIRYKTGSAPTSVTDGALVVDKLGSPSGADSYIQTGLTGGVTYYYAAFAHDAALNYSTSATASATPTAVQINWNTLASDTFTLVGARTPSIAVDTSGNVHVVYMVGTHIYYRVGDSSLNFGAAEQIPDTAVGPGNYNSPHLKLDSNNVPHVVFEMDWGPDSHSAWYTNRIGGSWDTPVDIIGNWNTERVNFPRLALGNGYAYVACFGVRDGAPSWAQGTLARVDNITTTPTLGKRVDIGYYVPHPFVNSAGQLFACGRAGTSGHKGIEFDSYSLAIIGTEFMLSSGIVPPGITGEEFGAYMDSNNVIHGAGIVGRINPLLVWYNNTARGLDSIFGMQSTAPDWPDVDVFPTIAVDTVGTIYVCYRRYETGEGWATRIINNNAFDSPCIYTPNTTSYQRWNPQVAPTKTGGIYIAWDQSGSAYIRSIGRGISAPDTTPPGPVNSFTATPGTGQVALTWTNPSDSDFTGTMIRYKTTGYPTGVTDGTLVVDDPGTPSAGDGYTDTGLTPGVTYYYSAWSHDAAPNYATTKRDASGTPTAPSLSTINTKSASNMNLVIDGATSDWTLTDFTTKSRGGQNEIGDYAIVGYDGGTCYHGGYNTSLVLPTSASDHTAKVYSRHCLQFTYFLVRCDDNDMQYGNPTSANWANDCIEFYIDPGHEHGATGLTHPGSSASDIQLVIDANNQKNAYCVTSGYATQVLNGVTSAVVRDGTGWWLEVKILKSALDPDMPASGSFGVEFCFRDNDSNNNATLSTVYGWRDNPSDTSYPHKVPDKWGDASLVALAADTTPPPAVTSFIATAGLQQVSLSWTNPQTADWAGTMIRFKTGSYPTGPTDGAQAYEGTGTSYTHTGLTGGVTYYYCAYSYDDVPNYATAAQANATPTSPALSTVNTKTASNMNLVIDGSSSDWVLTDFTTKSLGGQNTVGDYAIVGFDGATCYHGGFWTDGSLPTNAADHTGKVYSRHDQQYMFFLVRCDDQQMNYANATSANWANDCVEFYIDPGHDHGATALVHPGSSTSDIQLVIDANNQKNAYCVTGGYATQVLNGVTSAVVRDGTGWWLEVKILKTAVDPDLPASGTFGVDFCFRDNDNPDVTYFAGAPGYSTMYSWRDNPSGAAFPTKVPNVWGDASLATLAADTTAPAAVTAFTATPTTGQNALAWTNPQTHDWTGTMVRFKTTGYPTGPTDGTQIYNGTGSSYNHTGLTAGVTYYYCAYAYDEVPNYATAAQASGTVPGGGPYLIQNSQFTSNSSGWTIVTWKASPTLYQPGTMAWVSTGGNPSGCMQTTGSGSTDNDSRCTREGGEIYKVISTVGHSGIKVYYDMDVSTFGGNYTGWGSSSCAVDHDLIDEQATVFYSTNGGTNWTDAGYIARVALLAGYSTYATRMVDLSAITACNNNANFAVRLRFQFNTASDTTWIDNVRVEANN